jgi:hypothetical protein
MGIVTGEAEQRGEDYAPATTSTSPGNTEPETRQHAGGITRRGLSDWGMACGQFRVLAGGGRWRREGD